MMLVKNYITKNYLFIKKYYLSKGPFEINYSSDTKNGKIPRCKSFAPCCEMNARYTVKSQQFAQLLLLLGLYLITTEKGQTGSEVHKGFQTSNASG